MHLFQNSMHDMQSNDTMECMFVPQYALFI